MNNKKNQYILKQSKIYILPNERIILFHIENNKYLIIDTKFNYDEENYYPVNIGEVEEFDENDIENTNFNIENSQLYSNFLFQEYLKNKGLL